MDNRNKPRPIEIREKIRKALLGKKHPPERIEANRRGHIGLKHSYKTILKMQGRIPPNKGIPNSLETRKKISMAKFRNPTRYWLGKKRPDMAGNKNNFWKGGISTKNELDRGNLKTWRRTIFSRDKYKCQKCGNTKSGDLRAHHIKDFSSYPELRFIIENGITLCVGCHQLEHPNIKIT